MYPATGAAAGGAGLVGPATELGPTGDTCHSLSWFREQPDLLIYGVNSKSLKVHDLRAGKAGPSMVNYTRSVYGVCVDPWLDYRVASHHENQVLHGSMRNAMQKIRFKSCVMSIIM